MNEEESAREPRFQPFRLKHTKLEDAIAKNAFPSAAQMTEMYGSVIGEAIKESGVSGEYPVARCDLIVDFIRARGKVEEQDILSQYPDSIREEILEELSWLRTKGELRTYIEGEKRLYYVK